MNREDIIRMAREAGGVFIDPPCGDCYTFDIDDGTLCTTTLAKSMPCGCSFLL